MGCFPLQLVLVLVWELNKERAAPVSLEVQTCHQLYSKMMATTLDD